VATEHDALTQVLRAAHPGLDLRGVEVVERARCGDGLASTADRLGLRLELGDDPATREALPERAIVKTILLHPALRFGMPVILTTARVTRALARVPLVGRLAGPLVFASIGVYQRFFPHAPAAMYANEVRFYAELRPRLNIEAPRVYASHIDEQTGSFQIILEDLRERGASFPNATTGRTLAQARSWIANLARLHAEFWASPRFADTLAWVPRTNRGGMFPVFDGIGFDLIRDQVRRSPDKRELLAPLGRSLESLWADTWRAQALFEADPPTLCHGDAHVGNSYVIDDAVGLLDWQLMVRGCWAHDLGYALATGLSSEDRRAHEREAGRVPRAARRARRPHAAELRARVAALPPEHDLGPGDRLVDHAATELRRADHPCQHRQDGSGDARPRHPRRARRRLVECPSKSRPRSSSPRRSTRSGARCPTSTLTRAGTRCCACARCPGCARGAARC
jgi:aminoglycoside phosphotransferase (APT) family kinase protein